jgi:predicted Fe-Mo cluster-binding NifX family protein
MKLSNIINHLKDVISDCNLDIDDKTLFENGIKIFLSKEISKDKKENIQKMNEHKEFKRIFKNEITDKQLKFLQKNKIDTSGLDRETAKEVISNFINNQSKHSAKTQNDY